MCVCLSVCVVQCVGRSPVTQPPGFLFAAGAGGQQDSCAASSGVDGSALGLRRPVDISSLDPAIQFYCRRGIADSSRRSYQSAYWAYERFCRDYGVTLPLPTNEHVLCCFVGHLAARGQSGRQKHPRPSAAGRIASPWPEVKFKNGEQSKQYVHTIAPTVYTIAKTQHNNMHE